MCNYIQIPDVFSAAWGVVCFMS